MKNQDDIGALMMSVVEITIALVCQDNEQQTQQ